MRFSAAAAAAVETATAIIDDDNGNGSALWAALETCSANKTTARQRAKERKKERKQKRGKGSSFCSHLLFSFFPLGSESTIARTLIAQWASSVMVIAIAPIVNYNLLEKCRRQSVEGLKVELEGVERVFEVRAAKMSDLRKIGAFFWFCWLLWLMACWCDFYVACFAVVVVYRALNSAGRHQWLIWVLSRKVDCFCCCCCLCLAFQQHHHHRCCCSGDTLKGARRRVFWCFYDQRGMMTTTTTTSQTRKASCWWWQVGRKWREREIGIEDCCARDWVTQR